MKLLLDTNVVLWLLLSDYEAIPAGVQDALNEPTNDLVVSAASVWEISIKRSLGKLDVEPGWYQEILRLDYAIIPVTAEDARAVEDLPWHHRDPFDRLLIAQARTRNYALVTADTRMKDYDVPVLWH